MSQVIKKQSNIYKNEEQACIKNESIENKHEIVNNYFSIKYISDTHK